MMSLEFFIDIILPTELQP